MQIAQLGTNAERISVVVKNVDGGGSITTGLGVNLVMAGASIDGISAVKSVAAGWRGFIGIAIQDIPINGFGLATCGGYVASALISNVGTSITITRGDALIPGAVAGTFFSSITDQAMSTLYYRFVVAADTQTISGPAYAQGVVKACY